MEPEGRTGFSLLELMVALMFMGLLLAGMIRVYLASLASWNRVNEALTAQRGLRWAMDRIHEDLQMMGHLFPPPELRALDLAAGADPALQSAFRLVPGDGGSADEVSFVMDVPVPARAELGAAIVPAEGGAPAAPVPVRPARELRLRAGDLLLVAGDRFEFGAVAGPVTLSPGRTGPVAVVRADGAAGPAFAFRHEAGAPVQVVRPLRLVRYAVVPMALEAGRKARGACGQVPCLVRFETAYPKDRAVPRWSRYLDSSRSPGESHEVVAEQVATFQVDFTVDGRFPGIRGPGYSSTVANLDARIRALCGRDAAASSDPLWFRRVGGLVRVRLELRGPSSRGEPPARSRLLRGGTLLVAPRNFGL